MPTRAAEKPYPIDFSAPGALDYALMMRMRCGAAGAKAVRPAIHLTV
jgi:hypothetical protein